MSCDTDDTLLYAYSHTNYRLMVEWESLTLNVVEDEDDQLEAFQAERSNDR